MEAEIFVDKVLRFLDKKNLIEQFKKENPDFDEVTFQTIEEKIKECEKYKLDQLIQQVKDSIQEDERAAQNEKIVEELTSTQS